MEGPVIVVIVLAVPAILFPVAYVWYLNIGGLLAALREKRKATRRAAETHVVAR